MKPKQVLKAWQPITSLRGANYEMNIVEINKSEEYLKITIADLRGNRLEVVYDDPHGITPFESVVWTFRYNTELGSLDSPDLYDSIEDQSGWINRDAIRFFKMDNSKYISSFDRNPQGNKEMFPDVEHHIYWTGDEVFEVISNYEPRFIERRQE